VVTPADAVSVEYTILVHLFYTRKIEGKLEWGLEIVSVAVNLHGED